MNAINDPSRLTPAHHPSLDVCSAEQQPAATYTLRRTGRKAIRFEGWQLIEAVGCDRNRDVWHNLNIYRTAKDSLVVELTVRRASADHQDIFIIKTFNDLPAAAAWLENYRPADDVPIPNGLGAIDTGLPWAVLHAVRLRQSIDRIELDYRALLSEVFEALDVTEAPDVQQTTAQGKAASKSTT